MSHIVLHMCILVSAIRIHTTKEQKKAANQPLTTIGCRRRYLGHFPRDFRETWMGESLYLSRDIAVRFGTIWQEMVKIQGSEVTSECQTREVITFHQLMTKTRIQNPKTRIQNSEAKFQNPDSRLML